MDSIITTSSLVSQGLTRQELKSLVRAGTLTPIRRGGYLLGPIDPDEEDPGGYLAHRRLIEVTMQQVDHGSVLCLGSAAVLHDLPIWRHALNAVHVMRDGNAGSQCRAHVHVHKSPLTPRDVTVIDGREVTTLARTVADLGRLTPLMESVAMGDQALRRGLDSGDLQSTLRSMKRWPGVCNARLMADFLDIRSESAGESASRVKLDQERIPAPELQRVILDQHGEFVARVDFAWEEQKTVGEFDGAIKYGALLRPGQSVADVREAQDNREDRIRLAGWEVARWGWPQLGEGDEIARRVRAAFDRAHARGLT